MKLHLLATLALLAAPRCAPGAPLPEAANALVDQTGHAVRLAHPAKRIGTPGISLASLILALGGRDSLAALTPEVAHNPWLQRIVPGVSRLPTPFTRPAGANLEALLATHPDLVALWLGSDALRDSLHASGITVMTLGYTQATQMEQAVRLLGRALGKPARAERLIEVSRRNRKRVTQGLAGLPESARPRVYYASIAPLRTEGKDSLIDEWIRVAGGINVAARAGLRGDVTVQIEDLLRWNPQIIVTLDAEQARAIRADPRWRGIAAVRSGRVRVSPRGINAWSTRAAEAALQPLWAAQQFHPERFRTLDLGAETLAFYREFYGYALSHDELARVLAGEPPPGLNPDRRLSESFERKAQ